MQCPIHLFFQSLKILVCIVHLSQALWLHRRFLSLCTIRHLTTKHGTSCHFEQKTSMNNEINIFLDNVSCLLDYCSTIQDTEYEDFKAQAMYSAIYFLWLITVIQFCLNHSLNRFLCKLLIGCILCISKFLNLGRLNYK